MTIKRRPTLICKTGEEAKELRGKLGLNQTDFWARLGVTQSGGCRYESGRAIPKQVILLLHMAYGTDAQATRMLEWLRE